MNKLFLLVPVLLLLTGCITNKQSYASSEALVNAGNLDLALEVLCSIRAVYEADQRRAMHLNKSPVCVPGEIK